MSISSLGNLVSGLAPFAVVQQGVITQSSAGTATVACPDILAGDLVLTRTLTQTAPATVLVGTGSYTIAITAGTGFVATPNDNTMRGTYLYVVLRTTAPAVDATSA